MCIGYLELNQLNISLDMNGLLFLLFNILDHFCTTCFVFAKKIGKYFQSLFAIVKGIEMILQEAFIRFQISPPVSNDFPLTK
jgi:hypothetical protein